MNQNPHHPEPQPQAEPVKKSFIHRLLDKLDASLKKQADEKAAQGSCCCGEKKGGKCC